MSYSDPNPFVLAGISVTTTNTYTASDHVVTGTLGAGFLPEFPRHTRIKHIGIRVRTAGAGSSNTRPVVFRFLNGTRTFATATSSGASAGDEIDIVVAPTLQNDNLIANGVKPTLLILGTGTVSSDTGVSTGIYDIRFEQ